MFCRHCGDKCVSLSTKWNPFWVFFYSLFLGCLPSSAGEVQHDELQSYVTDLPRGEAGGAKHGKTSFLSKSSWLMYWNRSPGMEAMLAWGLQPLETSWPPELGCRTTIPIAHRAFPWCQHGPGQPCHTLLSLQVWDKCPGAMVSTEATLSLTGNQNTGSYRGF